MHSAVRALHAFSFQGKGNTVHVSTQARGFPLWAIAKRMP